MRFFIYFFWFNWCYWYHLFYILMFFLNTFSVSLIWFTFWNFRFSSLVLFFLATVAANWQLPCVLPLLFDWLGEEEEAAPESRNIFTIPGSDFRFSDFPTQTRDDAHTHTIGHSMARTRPHESVFKTKLKPKQKSCESFPKQQPLADSDFRVHTKWDPHRGSLALQLWRLLCRTHKRGPNNSEQFN